MKAVTKRKVGLPRLAWVIFTSGFITAYHCVQVILVSLIYRSKARSKVDRITRVWSRRLLNRVQMDIHVRGDFKGQLTPGKPTIIMCSHSSLYDIPVSFITMPGSIRMLAKKELFRIPLFSLALRSSEFLSIDRQNRDNAVKDLARARQKMKDGIVLWIAPEGTRSKDGRLLPFKKGGIHLAIETGADIVPVAIRDIHKVLPTKTLKLNLGQRIEVCIGKKIDASDYTANERTQLLQRVREEMQSLLHGDDDISRPELDTHHLAHQTS